MTEVAELRKELAQVREDRDEWRRRYKASEAAKRGTVTKHTPKTDEERIAMEQVFATWQRLFGYTKEKLTQARREIILARLRDGFTVDQLIAILTWASTDPWTRGTDPKSNRAWDDFVNIMGSRKKAEEKLLRASAGPSAVRNKSAELLGGTGKPTTIRTLGGYGS